VLLLGLALPAEAADRASPAAIEFFEKHVRPVLVERCVSCHGSKLQRGGLRLDSREALLKAATPGRRSFRQAGGKPAPQAVRREAS